MNIHRIPAFGFGDVYRPGKDPRATIKTEHTQKRQKRKKNCIQLFSISQ